MEIINLFRKSAKKITENIDIVETYKSLIPIFENAELYQEVAGIYEKLFNITQEKIYIEKVGDILLEKYNNCDIAAQAYNMAGNKEKLDLAIKNGGVLRKHNYFYDLEKDKYTIITYLIAYLIRNHLYENILEIYNYCENLPKDINSAKTISSLLSSTNKEELQELALIIDNTNEKAHINVMDKYIQIEPIEMVLEYFNKIYSPIFHAKEINKPSDLCWFLSDKYAQFEDYYKQVMYQSKAIDYEG